MINEIPNKPNHKIVGYKKIKPCKDDPPILYEPIYERILSLNIVYWDNSRNELIYLVSDTRGITCKGDFVEIDANQLEIPSKVSRITFFEFLSHNGYKIEDGKLLKFGCVYMTEPGILVICLIDGYHACDNTIFNYTPSRLADEFEEKVFFKCLNKGGFTYDPVHKCIIKSERYYYFPSYSLYTGFQPKKKKWINSDADKFYKLHGEDFVSFNDCANFCNNLNRSLTRDYPEIKLEE